MNKLLIICDRWMYGALLGLTFFLPYSFALIAVCQVMAITAWGLKSFLLWKMPSRQDGPQLFDFRASTIFWPLMALAALILVTVPFSQYPALSLRKFFSRFVLQIFAMVLVTQAISNRKRLYTMLAVLLGSLFSVTIDIAVQFFRGRSFVHHTPLIFGRVSGPMNHPNDLGTLLVTVLPVVLVLAVIFRKSVPWKIVVVFLFMILMLALGLSGSRGAWVAFAVSMMTLGVFFKRPKVMVFIGMMLIVFFWMSGLYCLSTRIDVYEVPMTQAPALHPSFINPWGLPAAYKASDFFLDPSGRAFYWETAANVIRHYPWFGCGYNAYVQTLINLHVGHAEYPHNSLLHITAELGLIGLTLYLWLFIALCRQIWVILKNIARDKDLYALGVGLACGILAWLIHSLLDTPWSSLQLGLLIWLFIGILFSIDPLIKEKNCALSA